MWGNLESPQPLGYRNTDGRTDWNAFRGALESELRDRHLGVENQTTTRFLAQHFFGRVDARAIQKMGSELQILRTRMELDDIELINLGNAWYIANRPEDHLRYIRKNIMSVSSRLKKANSRMQLGARNFPAELGNHHALRSLPEAEVVVGELKDSLDS